MLEDGRSHAAGNGASRIGERVDLMEVRRPTGETESFPNVEADHLIHIREGEGRVKTDEFGAVKRSGGDS